MRNNYNLIGRILFLCLIMFTSRVSMGQESPSSLFLKGNFLTEGEKYVKMLKGDSSNFETILYLTDNDQISIETDSGVVYGVAQNDKLELNGAKLSLNVERDYALFHIYIDMSDLSYKMTEISSLGIQTRRQEEVWSNEMDLSLVFKEKEGVLSFSLPYSILYQDEIRMIANHSEDLIWKGSIFSNTSNIGITTNNGELGEYYFTYYLYDGTANLSLNTEKSHIALGTNFKNVAIEHLASSYDEKGNKFTVGNCFDCSNDTVGYIQKNDEEKILFNISFPSEKRGDFFKVSEDGELVTLLIVNNDSTIIMGNQVITENKEEQLLLISLNKNLDFEGKKVLHKSSSLGAINTNGFDLAIDHNNNIFTQVYLSQSEVTINEVNEVINYDGVIQVDKWNSDLSHEANSLLFMSGQTNFKTSLMTVDKSENVYIIVDAQNVTYYWDGMSSTYVENNIKAFRFNIYNPNFRNNHNVMTTLSGENSQCSVLSIVGGTDIAYFSGIYNRGDVVNYYGDFNAINENIQKGFFIAKYDEFRLDRYMSIYDNEKLIQSNKIALNLDSADFCNVSYELSTQTEVVMDRTDSRVIPTQTSGIGITRFKSIHEIESFGELKGSNISLKGMDLDLVDNEIKINGNIIAADAYIQNSNELISINDEAKTFEVTFDGNYYQSEKRKHELYTIKELDLRGSAFEEGEHLVLTKNSSNEFYGTAYLNENGGVYLVSNNGDTLSFNEDMGLVVSDKEFQLENNDEKSMYAINVDIFKNKVTLKKLDHVSYVPYEDGQLGASIALTRVDHFSDKKLIKYISDEITLSSEFYFSFNNDTTLLFGEGVELKKGYPIKANEGRKARVVLYNDYENGFLSYDIVSDLTANIYKVELKKQFDYNSIEADSENIFQLGSAFEGNLSSLQKLNLDGELILEEQINLSTKPEFGNNMKVDPQTGKVVLVLFPETGQSVFIYKGQEYSITEGTRSIILYLDNEFNLLYKYESNQHISEISVTIDNQGYSYLTEFISKDNLFKIYKFNETSFETLSTIEMGEYSSYYITVLSVDKNNTLYFSSEIKTNSLKYNDVVVEGFGKGYSNSPLLAINTENGDLRWGKPLIYDASNFGGGGWPTGFQAGDSSIYVTGWILKGDSLLDGTINTDWEFENSGYYSNFLIKVDHNGSMEWGELLYHTGNRYNYGYTRLHVDEEENLYYILDIRSNAISSVGNASLYHNEIQVDEVLLKYNKDGGRVGETRLKPLAQFEDVTTINGNVVINGGVAHTNSYLRYQDFTKKYIEEERSSISLWIENKYNFTPPIEPKYSVKWNIDMNSMMNVGLFNPQSDTLSINVITKDSTYYVDLLESQEQVYNYQLELEEQNISYSLAINKHFEQVDSVRTHRVGPYDNQIDVMYQYAEEELYRPVTWMVNMNPLIESSLFDSLTDVLSIEIIIGEGSNLYEMTEKNSDENYTLKMYLPEGELTYGLFINSEKEDIEELRTYTVLNIDNKIMVDYSFSNVINFEQEHIVLEEISEEEVVINIDEELFESLKGENKVYHLMQKNGQKVPDYVIFDEDSFSVTIDVTKLPSGERKAAIEELELLLVGSDELKNSVVVELILDVQGYVDEIGNITSINDELKKHFKVYPTYIKESLNIETTLSQYLIQIMDINGKVIDSKTLFQSSKINTKHYPSGVLLLKITTNKGETVYKLIR